VEFYSTAERREDRPGHHRQLGSISATSTLNGQEFTVTGTGRKCHEYFMAAAHPCPRLRHPAGHQIRKGAGVRTKNCLKEGNRPIQITTIPYQDKNGEWLVAEINVDITAASRRIGN